MFSIFYHILCHLTVKQKIFLFKVAKHCCFVIKKQLPLSNLVQEGVTDNFSSDDYMFLQYFSMSYFLFLILPPGVIT